MRRCAPLFFRIVSKRTATSALLVATVGGLSALTGPTLAGTSRPGRLDPELSQACRRLEFNQRRSHRLYIGFRGKNAGTLAIATRDWNLRDPLDRAEPGVVYHFFNDGLSNCRVYVNRSAGRRRRR